MFSLLLYVSAKQSLHTESSTAAIASEALPASHWAHDADPFPGLNVPATHAAHDKPSSPVNPALHLQSTANELPVGESESCGQGRHKTLAVSLKVPLMQSVHAEWAVAAIPVDTLPASHCVHGVEPSICLNVPATHALHDTPSGPLYPELHLQSKGDPLVPAGAFASVGQGWHAVLPEILYVSARQSLHVDMTVAAVTVEYLPRKQ